jgi:hypothetical protein
VVRASAVRAEAHLAADLAGSEEEEGEDGAAP